MSIYLALMDGKVLLFHPLQQNWFDHFACEDKDTRIIGLTVVGQATVVALQMNQVRFWRKPSSELWWRGEECNRVSANHHLDDLSPTAFDSMSLGRWLAKTLCTVPGDAVKETY